MMTGRRVWLVAALALVFCLHIVPVTLAQEDTPTPLTAILTLEPLEPQPVGTRPTVSARLVNLEGREIPNKVLFLYVDGERIRQIRTDDLGIANIRISRDLPVGEYTVSVEFEGTEAYLPAGASMILMIRPIQLTIETVPPIANVSFSFEGQTFVSGADGLVQIAIDEPGTYDLAVTTVNEMQVDEETRVSFSRWADSTFTPDRTVRTRGDVHLQAGFTVSHPIGLSFSDLASEPVDDARVTSVTLKRSNGSYFTYEDGAPQWLMATRVVRRKEGLEAAPLLYSVESVTIDGANAVNRYQQRFYVEHADTWDIQLLMYSARITAADAVFGFKIGSGILLQYPDGREVELAFGEDGDVLLTSLARGLYHVQVKGVRGMAPLTPIALSKDQDVQLKVLSAFDIGAGIALGVSVALALLLYKRPHIITLVLGVFPRVNRRVPRPAALSIVSEAVVEAAPPQPETEPKPVAAAPPRTEPALEPVAPVMPSPESERRWFMQRFHPDGLKCPHCGDAAYRTTRDTRRSGLKVYRCSACQRTYTLYSGTPFERSSLTLAQSIRLLCDAASDRVELAHELGLNVKTVRKWRRRLRAAGALVAGDSSVERREALLSSVEHE